jgi:hypothetical protein
MVITVPDGYTIRTWWEPWCEMNALPDPSVATPEGEVKRAKSTVPSAYPAVLVELPVSVVIDALERFICRMTLPSATKRDEFRLKSNASDCGMTKVAAVPMPFTSPPTPVGLPEKRVMTPVGDTFLICLAPAATSPTYANPDASAAIPHGEPMAAIVAVDQTTSRRSSAAPPVLQAAAHVQGTGRSAPPVQKKRDGHAMPLALLLAGTLQANPGGELQALQEADPGGAQVLTGQGLGSAAPPAQEKPAGQEVPAGVAAPEIHAKPGGAAHGAGGAAPPSHQRPGPHKVPDAFVDPPEQAQPAAAAQGPLQLPFPKPLDAPKKPAAQGNRAPFAHQKPGAHCAHVREYTAPVVLLVT